MRAIPVASMLFVIVVFLVLAAWTSTVFADTTASVDSAGSVSQARSPIDAAAQETGAQLGIASGGGTTPGGLRVSGTYLYQLADRDWFDGSIGFTYGSDAMGCLATDGSRNCDHGATDGTAVDVGLGVRRFWPARGAFSPYARTGVTIRIARFEADDVRGLALPLFLGGGVRARLAPGLAVIAGADLDAGFGGFGGGLGMQPQLGLRIAAGAELTLR